MTATRKNAMPQGLLARARWAAENTPASRNRAVDLYRAVAILFVVLGHWLLVAPVIRDSELKISILLAEQPWTQYATWLFQVMPVFFFVGGYANGLSWASARRDPERAQGWASGRLARLLKPTVPLVLLWAVAAAIADKVGVSPDLIEAASQAALVPIWFLAVYIMITVVVPVSYAAWEKFGIGSILVLALGAITVDAVAFGTGQDWLRWSNYGFVWLTVHQLGYWWHTSDRTRTWAALFIALGVATLWLLIGPLGYPVSMVSVPGEEISNTRPPTVAMLAVGAVQVGVVLLLEAPVSRWLRGTGPWSLVILVNQMIMTVYLWHITAMIAVVGVLTALGGLGLRLEPGTELWWSLRPLWLVGFSAALVPFVALFLRFEASSRDASGTPGTVPTLTGATLTCAGLVMMALDGIGAANAIGVNYVAVILVLVGVGLATRTLPLRRA